MDLDASQKVTMYGEFSPTLYNLSLSLDNTLYSQSLSLSLSISLSLLIILYIISLSLSLSLLIKSLQFYIIRELVG